MTAFRRVEELHTRQSFEGKYVTYNAFLYQGPFTDYPYWADTEFNTSKMRAPRAGELFIARDGSTEANWPVEFDTWVMLVYTSGEPGHTLRNLTTEQLRQEFFPSETLGTDEAAAYFDSSEAIEGRAIVQVPVSYQSFQWQGVLHQIPWWLQEAIIKGGVTVRGPSLYAFISDIPARPGDWVLFTHGMGGVRIMSNDEYNKVVK